MSRYLKIISVVVAVPMLAGVSQCANEAQKIQDGKLKVLSWNSKRLCTWAIQNETPVWETSNPYKKYIDQLFGQLNLYKLRSKVEILNLSNEFVVAGMSYEKFLTFENAKDVEGFTIKYREDPIFLDPRSKKLGARLIINLEKLYLSLKKLELTTANVEDYYNLSHKLGVSQIDNIDLQNKIFGIECNFEELNGIDFKKGCYVGQENTARIKLKDKMSKRLFPIKLIKGQLEDDIIKYNNNEIGKILIKKKFPFASIKYLNENFDINKEFKCGNAIIKVIKPSWIK